MNTPPAESAAVANSANAPTINISKAALSGMQREAAAPTQAPPAPQKEGVRSVSAAVWSSDKRVSALYTTYHPRNSWMAVPDLGWKFLANGSDSAAEAMSLLAAHCREKACRIDFAEDGGLVTEMYVW